jgi:hypothetical protein
VRFAAALITNTGASTAARQRELIAAINPSVKNFYSGEQKMTKAKQGPTEKIPGVRQGNPVTLDHIRKAMQGISLSLRTNNMKSARLYTSDLLQYLHAMNLLPEKLPWSS